MLGILLPIKDGSGETKRVFWRGLIPLFFMLYLNEDAVNAQIKRCKKSGGSGFAWCEVCQSQQYRLCDLAKARVSAS